MPKTKQEAPKTRPKLTPARDPEDREQQMIAYAVDLAERQLREGTASSQVIVHYLKLATARERLERQNLEHDLELKKSKKKQIDSMTNLEEIFNKGFEAMRDYTMPHYDDFGDDDERQRRINR